MKPTLKKIGERWYEWHFLPEEGHIPQSSYLAGFADYDHAIWYGEQRGWRAKGGGNGKDKEGVQSRTQTVVNGKEDRPNRF